MDIWRMSANKDRHVGMVKDVIATATHERPSEFPEPPGPHDYEVGVNFLGCLAYSLPRRFSMDALYGTVNLKRNHAEKSISWELTRKQKKNDSLDGY